MSNTFGITKINEKSFSNEKTAYLLFYQAVDDQIQSNEMQIENSIVGVED